VNGPESFARFRAAALAMIVVRFSIFKDKMQQAQSGAA
jgi:hypothetical protein